MSAHPETSVSGGRYDAIRGSIGKKFRQLHFDKDLIRRPVILLVFFMLIESLIKRTSSEDASLYRRPSTSGRTPTRFWTARFCPMNMMSPILTLRSRNGFEHKTIPCPRC